MALPFQWNRKSAPLPRSLSNIFKELQDEFHETPPNGDLRFWARQGVLLLNTALTVKAGNAGAHAKLGWSQLARDVLRALSDQPRAFLLWGKHAQSFASEISGQDHLLIQTAHPSPLSARRGFFGARPFSKTNAWLKAQGHAEINWTRP